MYWHFFCDNKESLYELPPISWTQKWEAVHIRRALFMPFTEVHLERGVCAGKILKS